jgi:predicted ATPase
LEQIVANREFRPIADFFQTVSYQHLVPQVVRDPKGFSPAPVVNDPFGRDLLLRIYSTDAKVRDARLRRIGKVLNQAVPQLQGLEVEMDQKGVPHLIGRYEHWRPHAAKQNEAQFSDGTLRLFGLMWAMLEGTGPILIEEPELSLHPEVVSSLPQLLVQLQEEARRMKRKRAFTDRQVIISTHSKDLLSDKGIAPSEVIQILPSPEGSRLVLADDNDVLKMDAGLSAADVLLPKSNPLSQPLVLTD